MAGSEAQASRRRKSGQHISKESRKKKVCQAGKAGHLVASAKCSTC